MFPTLILTILSLHPSLATWNFEPLQHDEQVPHLISLVPDTNRTVNGSQIVNQTVIPDWTRTRSLKTLLRDEIGKFRELDEEDCDKTASK
ncbi:hypothetical protein M8J77_017661 [Diaphorina citri]|nr:hypothetical protein M8J77_017661 [Diaphorina citri]